MRDTYRILAMLEKKGVYFCLQSQGDGYTNLSVDDPKGKNHSYSAKKFDDVELFLKTMWSHLITPALSVAPVTTIPKMPAPVGFPMPPR